MLNLLLGLTVDTARVVERRVIVEPLGVSVEMPAHWFPTVATPSPGCITGKTPVVFAPLSPNRAELAVDKTRQWHPEYSSVADSVVFCRPRARPC